MKGNARSQGRAPVGTEASPRRLRIPINTTVTAAAAGAGVGFGNATIGALPEGNILLLSSGGYFNFTSSSANLTATWGGSFSVGSTADADGSLAGTEVNIVASSTIAAATSKTSNNNKGLFAGSNASPGTFTASPPQLIVNTNKSVNAILNVVVNAADITDATSAPITVTGYLDLVFMVLGDN